jgi:transposase
VYQELIEVIRQCSEVHADETSWRNNTLSAWLWVFTNHRATVYTIRDNRSSDVVIEILGEKFKGVLVSDCFVAYDDGRLKAWLKQKCLAHLLNDLKKMTESQTGRAIRFTRDVTAVLQEVLKLKAVKPTLDPQAFLQIAQVLEAQLDTLISTRRRLKDPQNARFAKRLRKHRPHLPRFLYVDSLEATNNRAERGLRSGVITRKTNGCNRTDDGADDHAILTNVLETCHQNSVPIPDYMVKLQRFGETHPLLVSPLSAPPRPVL